MSEEITLDFALVVIGIVFFSMAGISILFMMKVLPEEIKGE